MAVKTIIKTSSAAAFPSASGSANQVLSLNSTASATVWKDETYRLLYSTTIDTAVQTVDITNIPQTHSNLLLYVDNLKSSTTTTGTTRMTINNLTTASYGIKYTLTGGTTLTTVAATSSVAYWNLSPSANPLVSSSSEHGSFLVFQFPNYASSTIYKKTYVTCTMGQTSQTSGPDEMYNLAGYVDTILPITSIQLYSASSANVVAVGTTIRLYGLG